MSWCILARGRQAAIFHRISRSSLDACAISTFMPDGHLFANSDDCLIFEPIAPCVYQALTCIFDTFGQHMTWDVSTHDPHQNRAMLIISSRHSSENCPMLPDAEAFGKVFRTQSHCLLLQTFCLYLQDPNQITTWSNESIKMYSQLHFHLSQSVWECSIDTCY